MLVQPSPHNKHSRAPSALCKWGLSCFPMAGSALTPIYTDTLAVPTCALNPPFHPGHSVPPKLRVGFNPLCAGRWLGRCHRVPARRSTPGAQGALRGIATASMPMPCAQWELRCHLNCSPSPSSQLSSAAPASALSRIRPRVSWVPVCGRGLEHDDL